mmetsp:Transcript_17979/g.32624  ORF Transcript_17979/g.32624 Transcript_17979/m.32624 type:complete len:256 (-) Transcript_17979:60-827(-)
MRQVVSANDTNQISLATKVEVLEHNFLESEKKVEALPLLAKSVEVAAPAILQSSAPVAPSPAKIPASDTLEVDSTALALGIHLSGYNGEHLIIDSIDAKGVIHQWNQSHQSRALNSGDHIVEVNDVRGDPRKMVEEISKRKALGLAVRWRGDFFAVDIDRKSAMGLGLEVNGETGETLIIQAIHDGGLANEWNKSNRDQPLSHGDHIVQINDIYGDSKRLLLALQKRSKLRLTLKRGTSISAWASSRHGAKETQV